MISAGQIGGGDQAAEISALQTQVAQLQQRLGQVQQPPAATVGTPGGLELSAQSAPLTRADLVGQDGQGGIFNRMLDLEGSKLMWGTIGNISNQVIGAAAGIWSQSIMWTHAEKMKNAEWKAAVDIDTHRTELGNKSIDAALEMDQRMNGPNGLKRELAQIDANKQITMYDRHETSQERIAATRSVDNAFSYGRNDYNYGNPFAA